MPFFRATPYHSLKHEFVGELRILRDPIFLVYEECMCDHNLGTRVYIVDRIMTWPWEPDNGRMCGPGKPSSKSHPSLMTGRWSIEDLNYSGQRVRHCYREWTWRGQAENQQHNWLPAVSSQMVYTTYSPLIVTPSQQSSICTASYRLNRVYAGRETRGRLSYRAKVAFTTPKLCRSP